MNRVRLKSWVKYFVPLVLLIALYFLFFYEILSPNKTFWESDVYTLHYPIREYLRRSLLEYHRFPFWTERVYLGFPLYADMQHSYLNPVNIISILLFGPFTSFKVVHFFTYLIGSGSFLVLLRRHGMGILEGLTAVTVFYFGFFHLNHTIHYNVMAVTMTFPLSLLLTDLFAQKKEKKYLLAQAVLVAYGFYWGHPQFSLFQIILIAVYLITIKDKLNLRSKFIYLILVGVLSLLLALPQLIPNYKMYVKSQRSETTSSVWHGSLPPQLSLSYIFPRIYSSWGYFYGKDISSEYSYTELYNYLGISALSLFSAYLLFFCREPRNDRYFKFGYVLLWVFLFLAHLRYVPILSDIKLPVISVFRYWPRAAVIVSAGLALVCARAVFMIRVGKIKPAFNQKTVMYLAAPLLFLLLLHLINYSDPILQNVQRSLVDYRWELLLKRDIGLWLLLPLVVGGLVYLSSLKTSAKKSGILAAAVLLTLIIDLRYFGQDPLSYRIDRLNYDPGIYPPQYISDRKRLIEEGDLVLGMKPLLNSAHTPYGYSVFYARDYEDFFRRNNLGVNLKTSFVSKDLRPELDLQKLKSYGFSYIQTKNEVIILRNEKTPYFLSEDLPVKVLTNDEGHIKFSVSADNKTWLKTTIKFDPNWKIVVNGQVVKPQVWEEIFISLPVSQGTNIVELTYVPYDLWLGLALGGWLSLILLLLLRYKIRL